MSWYLAGRPLHRVLVSRLRYLGDVIMSTVVLQALRLGDRDLEIDYLCEHPYAPVLDWCPQLAQSHVLRAVRRGADARARTAAQPGKEPAGKGTWRVIRDLRKRRYDLAIDLYFNPRSALLLRFSNSRFRISGGRNSRSRFYTHIAESIGGEAGGSLNSLAPGGLADHLSRLAPLTHGTDERPFLEWIAEQTHSAPWRPRLVPPSAAATTLAAVKNELGLHRDRPVLILAPGATWPTKAWPASHWRDLVRRLESADHTLVVLTPPGADLSLADALADLPVVVSAPRSLQQVFVLLADSVGVIAVDGGIMHAAVALGRPTVGLFGPTDPALWFPYEASGPFRVLATRPSCHPCDLHVCRQWICMPDLTADQVVQAWREVHARGAIT